MTLEWFIAIVLADGALGQLERLIAAGDDNELARAIIRSIRDAIQQSTANVLAFMRQARLDELSGRVDGLFVTFARYAEDPLANHQRLVNLIDDLAQIIGEMNRSLARIDSDETMALNMFSPYAAAVALSAVAITERRERFAVHEPTAGILEQARDNALRVQDVLRRRSDARFRFTAVTVEPGIVGLGCTFAGVYEEHASVDARGNPKEAISYVNRIMADRQTEEFDRFGGVAELRAFITQLKAAANLERFVDATHARKSMFRPMVEEIAKNGERKFRLA